MISALVLTSCLVALTTSLPQQYNPQPFSQQQPQRQQFHQPPPPPPPPPGPAPQQRQQFNQPPPQQQPPQQQLQGNKPTNPPVPIISLDNSVNFDGSYRYSFEGGDGTRAEQQGQLKPLGNEAGEVSQGSYSYVGDDGKTYTINYIADETGYHPVGDHLPQPPPIPEAILKSLEYLATAPPTQETETSQAPFKQ